MTSEDHFQDAECEWCHEPATLVLNGMALCLVHFDVELGAMGAVIRSLIQGAMDDIMGEQRCGYTWELLDPNEEDASLGRTHTCRLSPDQHRAHHVCACGDTHAR